MLTFSWRRNCDQRGFNNSLFGLSLTVGLNLETCKYQQRERELCLLWSAKNIKTFKVFGLHFKLCLLQEAHEFLYSKASSKPTIKREKHELHKASMESPEQSCLKIWSAWNELPKTKAEIGRLGPTPNTAEVLQLLSPLRVWEGIISHCQLLKTGPERLFSHAAPNSDWPLSINCTEACSHPLSCRGSPESGPRSSLDLIKETSNLAEIFFLFPSLVIPCLPKANRKTVVCAYEQPGFSALLLCSYVTFFCATYNFH